MSDHYVDPDTEAMERLAVAFLVLLVAAGLIWHYFGDYLPFRGGDPCNASVADRVACDNAMYSGYDEAAQHDPR